MYKSFWNFVGLAAGWLGGKRLNGDVDYTPSLDGVMGVAGTFIGGVFICVSGICSGSGRTVLTTVVAMICVALLASSVSKGSRRRVIVYNS